MTMMKKNCEKNVKEIIDLKLADVKKMMDGFVSLPVSELEKFPMILQMILYSITG